ncbi:Histone deacetylase complex subunit CTI6 [Nakaseomyces bracarensis]|uniref:Histone deacetylase complex subunit CTI6 n=1 Tax=Nakaseomyces bracarensis TaxID=273131 RepID=A0ABR4NMS5_9SACH
MKRDKEVEEVEEEEEGETRCICGEMEPPDDSGFFIQCEQCNVWQHGVCVGISNTADSKPPDKYWCEQCRPELHRLYYTSDTGELRSAYKPVLENKRKNRRAGRGGASGPTTSGSSSSNRRRGSSAGMDHSDEADSESSSMTTTSTSNGRKRRKTSNGGRNRKKREDDHGQLGTDHDASSVTDNTLDNEDKSLVDDSTHGVDDTEETVDDDKQKKEKEQIVEGKDGEQQVNEVEEAQAQHIDDQHGVKKENDSDGNNKEVNNELDGESIADSSIDRKESTNHGKNNENTETTDIDKNVEGEQTIDEDGDADAENSVDQTEIDDIKHAEKIEDSKKLNDRKRATLLAREEKQYQWMLEKALKESRKTSNRQDDINNEGESTHEDPKKEAQPTNESEDALIKDAEVRNSSNISINSQHQETEDIVNTTSDDTSKAKEGTPASSSEDHTKKKTQRRSQRGPARTSSRNKNPRKQQNKNEQDTNDAKGKTVEIGINKPVKPRLPPPRTTLNEMRRRIAALMEYLSRTQWELEEENRMQDELTKFVENEDFTQKVKQLFETNNENLKLMDDLTKQIIQWDSRYSNNLSIDNQ